MADLEAIDTRDLHEALAKKINGEVRAFSKLRARTPSSDSSWPRARGRRLLAAGLVGAGFSLRLRRSLKAAATGKGSAFARMTGAIRIEARVHRRHSLHRGFDLPRWPRGPIPNSGARTPSSDTS